MPDTATITPTRQGPFDQILATERERDDRLRHASADIERERAAKEDALLEEERAATEAARAKAREELVAYKNERLPVILKEAKDEATAEVARIEREGSARVAKAADAVVARALSPEFPLSL